MDFLSNAIAQATTAPKPVEKKAKAPKAPKESAPAPIAGETGTLISYKRPEFRVEFDALPNKVRFSSCHHYAYFIIGDGREAIYKLMYYPGETPMAADIPISLEVSGVFGILFEGLNPQDIKETVSAIANKRLYDELVEEKRKRFSKEDAEMAVYLKELEEGQEKNGVNSALYDQLNLSIAPNSKDAPISRVIVESQVGTTSQSSSEPPLKLELELDSDIELEIKTDLLETEIQSEFEGLKNSGFVLPKWGKK